MNNFVLYLIVSSLCLTVSYAFYKLFIENYVSPKIARTFLLMAIITSLFLPFHSYRIDIGVQPLQHQSQFHSSGNITGNEQTKAEPQLTQIPVVARPKNVAVEKNYWFWVIIRVIYFSGVGILFMRLIVNLLKIINLRMISTIKRIANYRVLITPEVKNSFSFFRWIFINILGKSESEVRNILLHERIHSSQYHTVDILLMELVIAFMWFNPVVWFMRRMLQQIHEYLADEGALKAGINKPVYEAHILNQVAEERLIALSSGFNPATRSGRHSIIKKRIIMMTKPKLSQKTNLRFLTIIPLFILLFAGVACMNGKKSKEESKTVAAVAPTKMNVVYLGLDNPMSIAVSGYEANELKVEVDSNGRISGENGQYIIRPIRPGTLKVYVYANDNLVSETHFRVKTVPDPVAMVAGKKGGPIRKEDLIHAGKVEAVMENFDFDLRFVVVEFTVSAALKGYVIEYKSNSDKITQEQIDLIEKLKPTNSVYIQDIKAIGPDGALRALGTINFKIE